MGRRRPDLAFPPGRRQSRGPGGCSWPGWAGDEGTGQRAHKQAAAATGGGGKTDVPFCYPSPVHRDWSAQLGVDQRKKKKRKGKIKIQRLS